MRSPTAAMGPTAPISSTARRHAAPTKPAWMAARPSTRRACPTTATCTSANATTARKSALTLRAASGRSAASVMRIQPATSATRQRAVPRRKRAPTTPHAWRAQQIRTPTQPRALRMRCFRRCASATVAAAWTNAGQVAASATTVSVAIAFTVAATSASPARSTPTATPARQAPARDSIAPETKSSPRSSTASKPAMAIPVAQVAVALAAAAAQVATRVRARAARRRAASRALAVRRRAASRALAVRRLAASRGPLAVTGHSLVERAVMPAITAAASAPTGRRMPRAVAAVLPAGMGHRVAERPLRHSPSGSLGCGGVRGGARFGRIETFLRNEWRRLPDRGQ